MKRFYKFLTAVAAIAALAFPTASHGQLTLTVADGTTTNNYVPVYGYYCDAYLRADFVYPSNDLTAMSGSLVSQLTFYASTSSVSWGSASFNVYAKEISSSTLSGFDDGTGMTLIYSGPLSITNSQMVVNLTSPFFYSGGNLLLRFDNVALGTYVTATFYGISATNSCYQGYDYDDIDDISPTARGFLPKVQFTYAPAEGYCPSPSSLAVRTISSSSATIGWTTSSYFTNVSSFQIEYGEQGFEPGEGTSLTTTADSIELTGLNNGTHYDVYLYTNCTEGSSDTVMLSFFTPANPVDQFPYTTGFEEDEDSLWFMHNGTATNQWFLGSATNNGGSRSLYISHDNGASNSYDITKTSNVYAYRAFNFAEAGDYAVTFDWNANGESSYDYLYAYLAPRTTDFTAASMSTSGWVNFSGRLNLSTSWQTQTNAVSIETPGTYYLVFYWHNDDSQGTQPPAAIDNINVSRITCPAVRNLAVDTNSAITSTSVTLDWTSVGEETSWAVRVEGGEWETASSHPYTVNGLMPATAYTFEVVALCGDTSFVSTVSARTACGEVTALPFTEGFEGMPTGSGNRPVCWTTVVADGSYPYISTTTHTGSGSLYLYCRDTTSNMVASPLFSGISANQLHVKFWARASSYGTLYVGLMTDTANLATFEVIDSVVNGNATWNEYECYTDNVTTSGDFYLAFRWSVPGTSRYSCYIDDIDVSQALPCRRPSNANIDSVSYYTASLSWTDNLNSGSYVVRYSTVNDVESEDAVDVPATDTEITLTGLTPYTLYYAWVATECDGTLTDWRAAGSFRTLRTCYPVTNLTVDETTATAASISWQYNSQVGIEPSGVIVTVSNASGVVSEVFVDGTSLLLSHLQVSTDYNVSIRTLCAPDTAEAVTANFSTASCSEITGTSTVTYAPLYGLYNYSYTQTIYPASVLAGMDSINGIAYRVATTSTMARTFDVYIGYTNLTTLSTSDYLPFSSLTQVASVTGFDVSSTGWKSINFNAPVAIDHTQNIVIAVVNNTGSWNGFSWGGHSQSQQSGIGNSVYWYRDASAINTANPSDGSPSSGATTTIPDIRFLGNCNLSCAAPLLMIDSIDATSATLTWTADGVLWVPQYRAASSVAWIDATASSDTSVVINGLSPSTIYNFRVMTICEEGDTVYSSVLNGQTDCAPIASLPFEENFDALTLTGSSTTWFHPCWPKGGSSSSYMPYITTYNGSQVLHFYNYGSSSYGYVVLPEFDASVDFTTLELTFDARKASTTASYGGQLIVAALDSAGFTPTDSYDTLALLNLSNTEMEPQYIDLTSYTGSRRRIALINVCPEGTTYNYVDIDNLSLHLAPSCLHPDAVEVTASTGTTLTVHVTGEDGATWRCYYTAAGATDSIDATSPTFTLTGLNQLTTYTIVVTRICSDGSHTGTVHTTGSTTMIGATVPYSTGFEADDDVAWQLVNGSQTNKWAIGTATHSDSSASALYISNDNGATNSYAISSTSNVYAYKTIDFGPGQYMVSYDWKGMAESCCDYLRVFIVPGNVTLTAGNTNNISTTATPDGWIAIDGGGKLNQESTWQHRDEVVSFSDSNTAMLVFFWHNDYSTGTMPPAAVDNISVVQLTCPAPANLAIDSVSTDEVTLSWTALGNESEWSLRINGDVWQNIYNNPYTVTGLNASTYYTFELRANCGADDTSLVSAIATFTECNAISSLPYTQDFEGLATGSNAVFDPCWTVGGTRSDETPYVTTYNNSQVLRTYAYQSNIGYAILPEFDESIDLNTLELSFDMRKSSTTASYTAQVIVAAFDSLPTDATTMVYDTIAIVSTDNNDFEIQYIPLSSYSGNAHYLGFVMRNSTATYNHVQLDNIDVHPLPSCPNPTAITLDSATSSDLTFHWVAGGDETSWQVVINDTIEDVAFTNSYVASALSANTSYTIVVRALCGAGDTSNATYATFRTACGDITTLPWTENFESHATGQTPTCWTVYGGNPRVMASVPHDGSRHLYFSGSNSNMIAMPPMGLPINSLQVRFWTRPESFTSSSCGTFSVGYMTDANDASSFVALETYNYSDFSAYEEKEVPFVAAPDSAVLIAFRHNANSSVYYWYVDDVVVEPLPSCARPMAVDAVASTATDITVDITGASDANYRIYWTDGTVTDSTTAAGTSHTITGLNASTTYTISVATLCDDNTLTSTVSTIVRTPCAAGGCDVTIEMVDSYGDGWNGNAILGYIGGTQVFSATIGSGSNDTYTYSLCATETLTLLWEEGNYAYETSFTISNGGFELSAGGSDYNDGDTLGVITGCPSCMRPTQLTVSNVTSTSATLTWTPAGSETEWQVAVGSMTTIVSTPYYTVTGLNSATSYSAKVRAICSATDTGYYCPAVTFTTNMCDNGTTAYNYNPTASSTTTTSSPIGNSYYNYSYVQTIVDSAYLASLGGAITTIAFNPMETDGGDDYNNMDVYMANISESTFNTNFIHPDSTHVFTQVVSNGNFNFTTTGWQYVTLDSTFSWDGHSNLLIAVNRRNGSYSTSNDFSAHTATGKMRYINSDNTLYDINTVTGGTNASAVGDIMLVSCGSGSSCEMPVITNINADETTVAMTFSGTADSYEVAIVEGTNWVAPATGTPATGTSHTFTGLTGETLYTVGVRAVCGSGSYSAWTTSVVNTASHPCTNPTGLAAADITLNGATLSWIAPAEQNAWQIRISGLNYCDTLDVSTNPYTVSGLVDGETYTVEVRAVCSELSMSDWCYPTTFTTLTCIVPGTPTVSSVTATSAVVNWTTSSSTVGNFEIEYGLSGFSQGYGTLVPVNGATTFILTGLTPNRGYDVYVRSVCADGVTSLWSPSATFNTLNGNPDATYYTVTVNVNDPAMGYVTGAGQYEEGTTATLIAVANEGYRFESWSTGETATTITVTVNSDITLTANFSSVGIDEVNANNISLYPNPATSTVTLAGIEGTAEVTIVDMHGRAAGKWSVANGELTIDVATLAQGAYFVRIVGDQVNAIRKLIVR